MAADGPEMATAFRDLLLEIDRLRSVSQHIEALVNKHPGMEDGLMCVAGNIRSIASVLDVFTLIRSKAGGPQKTRLIRKRIAIRIEFSRYCIKSGTARREPQPQVGFRNQEPVY